MNERQNPRQTPRFKPKKKRRGAAVAAVLCFVAAIAVVGTYTFKDYRETQREFELAQAREQEQKNKEESEAANTDKIFNEKEEDVLAKQAEEAARQAREEQEMKEAEQDSEEEKESEEQTEQTAGNSESLNFANGSKLLWPVEGTLLMNYSMDKTVYFSTLDQFKYNPALVISGEKGDQVISSAPGIVKSIDKTAETGTTVNVDIGSGYELFYGQLDDVRVKTGDYVDSKTVLGYVGEPTIYYSVEGANVYFEMRKDGESVNPMDYLVE